MGNFLLQATRPFLPCQERRAVRIEWTCQPPGAGQHPGMHSARPLLAFPRRCRTPLAASLSALAVLRRPLFREMARLAADPDYRPEGPADRCCRTPRNRMRISSLEALAIARALERVPALARRRARILAASRATAAGLDDDEQPQGYDCPLLEAGRCLVHRHAKPIACLAWNEGVGISSVGLRALARRDLLARDVYGPTWELKAIPLLLGARVSMSSRDEAVSRALAQR